LEFFAFAFSEHSHINLRQRDFIHLIIRSPCSTSLISSFLFFRALLLLRVRVFSVQILSSILSTSVFLVVCEQVSAPQVRMGPITVISTGPYGSHHSNIHRSVWVPSQ
jgi:hypothetical protein